MPVEVIGAALAWCISYLLVQNRQQIFRIMRGFLRAAKTALLIVIAVIIFFGCYTLFISQGQLDKNVKPQPIEKAYLEIHAVDTVWLSVAFGNEQPVFRKTLNSGEAMRWEFSGATRVLLAGLSSKSYPERAGFRYSEPFRKKGRNIHI